MKHRIEDYSMKKTKIQAKSKLKSEESLTISILKRSHEEAISEMCSKNLCVGVVHLQCSFNKHLMNTPNGPGTVLDTEFKVNSINTARINQIRSSRILLPIPVPDKHCCYFLFPSFGMKIRVERVVLLKGSALQSWQRRERG